MAQRYPTQPLSVAASTPTLSFLHLVSTEDSQRAASFQAVTRASANFRTPMAYIIINDKNK